MRCVIGRGFDLKTARSCSADGRRLKARVASTDLDSGDSNGDKVVSVSSQSVAGQGRSHAEDDGH